LLDLSYFDVSTAFVPDIMHDLLEGVIPNLVHKLIVKAFRDKIITLEVLNEGLEQVSKNIGDRPNALKSVSPSGSITGSASQKWHLFLLLPQILGRYIDEGDTAWQVYLLLRDITDIVFSPVVLRSSLSFLQCLIVEFLIQFSGVFGVSSVTPKHHYMIHYARLIGEYGPLRHLWCMRFEAKHQYFKSVIATLGNYINVTNTMANRHQMRQSWEFLGDDILQCEARPLSKTRVWPMSHLPAELRASISSRLQVEVCASDIVTTTAQLQRDHVIYKVDACFILGVVEEEDTPVFVKIKYILMYHDLWLLCGRLCFTQQFHHHLHAFSVNVDDKWAVIYPGEEADYSSHEFFVLDDCNFVSCRYLVPKVDALM
jgi:hypothetical protein